MPQTHRSGPFGIINRIVSIPLVTRLLSPVVVRIDRPILKLTKGHFSPTGFVSGWPIIQLQTTGAKTGQARKTTLIGIPAGKNIIVIASNFGKPAFPAWYYNLKKNPHVIVSSPRFTQTYLAHETTEIEKQKYWEMALATYPGFQYYAESAGRRVPVIVLEPE